MYTILVFIKNFFSKKYLCKAPFNNIYVSGDGSVTPCCFNRTDILGNIYETPLKEILNSSKSNELKATIKKGVFPIGCKFCKTQVNNKNKANSGIETYEKFPVFADSLSVIEFELSYKCNLRCPMCRLNDDNLLVNPVKTKNKEYDIISQITPYLNKVKLMRFYGGEPFFIEEYYTLWEYVINNNYKSKFLIQTNGTILNSRIEKLLMNGTFNFNMSLDSLNKSTYEIIRKGANFEVAMQNLTKLHTLAQLKHQTMSISVCPMRLNWKEMPDILEFCNKNNLYLFFNTVSFPWNMAIWSMTSLELSTIYDYYKSFTFSTKSKVSIINNHRWKSFINQILSWQELAKNRPQLSITEINNAKLQILEIIKEKTESYIIQNKISIDYNVLQLKIFNTLNEILKYISISTIIENLKKSNAENIYKKVIEKDESTIIENTITL